ncbi:MAG TPA: DoxX family protein [Chitinophagaceae bacterium]|nr:DoxX family protein [Chitinophagaceae bacterium]HUM64566.1 DoxX family protein [Chitinophagaceae bacterium]
MDLLHRLEYWGDRHHPRWMDIVRIALGIFLIYKGIDFLRNMGDLITLMSIKTSFGEFSYILIGHLVVFAHIMGGIFIALGVLTRFACLMQIPILLGAVFLINRPGGMAEPYSELLISLVVLLLLFYFLIAGNGPLSVKINEPEKVRH